MGKMRALALVLSVIMLLTMFSSANSQTTGGEWLSAGAGPHNMKYSYASSLSSDNVGELFQEWFLPVPPSRVGGIHGVTHPILVKYGVGYAVTNGYLVYSFDLRGGKIFWTIELQPPPALNPSVSSERLGHIYQVLLVKAGSDELLVVGTSWQRIYLLDSFTGRLVHAVDLLTPNEAVDGNIGKYGGIPVNIAYDSRRNILITGSTSPDTENSGRGFIDGYAVSQEGVRRVWRIFLMPPQTHNTPEWTLNFVKNTRYAWAMDGDDVVNLKALDENLLLNDWMAAAGSPPKAGVMASWMNGWALDEDAGVVYVGVSHPMPSLDAEGRRGPNIPSSSVLALKVETGEVLWLFQAIPHDVWGYGCNGGVSLVGNTVLALCGNGVLYALDKDTGQMLWMFEPPVNTGGNLSQLSIHDTNQMNTPYMGYGVQVGKTVTVSPPPKALLSYAVNPNSRSVYYAFPLYSESIEVKPPLRSKNVFSQSQQSNLMLYSVDLSTGRLLWEKKLEGVGSSFISAASDIVLVQTSSSGLYIFSEKDGEIKYSKPAIGTTLSHATVGVDVEGGPRIIIAMSSVTDPGYIASFRLLPKNMEQNGTVSVITEHTTITRTVTMQLNIADFSGGGWVLYVIVVVLAASALTSLFFVLRRSRESRSV